MIGPRKANALDKAIAQAKALVDLAKLAAAYMAYDLKDLVQEGIASRTSPDGTAWAPLKGPSESRGRMSKSVRATVWNGSPFVKVWSGHASYQSARRPILPGDTLPPAWHARCLKSSQRAFGELVK